MLLAVQAHKEQTTAMPKGAAQMETESDCWLTFDTVTATGSIIQTTPGPRKPDSMMCYCKRQKPKAAWCLVSTVRGLWE